MVAISLQIGNVEIFLIMFCIMLPFFFGAIILTHTAYPFAQGSWKGDRSWKDVCEVLRVCDVKIDSNG